jgi:periplasmic protein TonB
MAREAWVRLFVAVTLSAAVHASLIFGVAIRSSHPQPDHTWISAKVVNPAASLVDPSPDGKSSLRKVALAAPIDPGPTPGSHSAAENVQDAAAPVAPNAIAVAPAQIPTPSPSRLPPVDMPLITDANWYQARQLDVFPRALSAVRPAYPELAMQAALNGEVTIELLIDESGQVHAAEVVRAVPEGYFESAAVQAFRAARFVPGQKDGHPVRSRVVVKVMFSPDDDARD